MRSAFKRKTRRRKTSQRGPFKKGTTKKKEGFTSTNPKTKGGRYFHHCKEVLEIHPPILARGLGIRAGAQKIPLH